jgi:hypothetical protein
MRRKPSTHREASPELARNATLDSCRATAANFGQLAGHYLGTVNVEDDFIGPELSEILALIARQEELRFFVDGTRNLGHQASTIALMKRLIDRVGYAGKIRLVYADYDNRLLGRTGEKLALMLPGLDPSRMDDCVLDYGTCRHISFVNYQDRRILRQHIDFAFTGGADDMSVNYARELKVRYFTRIQPYLWDDEALRKNDPYYETSSVERPDGYCFYPVDACPDFRLLAYKYPAGSHNVVEEEVWNWYSENGQYDIGLKTRTRNIRTLTELNASSGQTLLWPVYGLQHFHAHVAHMVLSIVFSAMLAQPALGKNIVVLSFSPPERITGWDGFVGPLADDLGRGDAELSSFREALAKRPGDGTLPKHMPADHGVDDMIGAIPGGVHRWIGSGGRLRLISGHDESGITSLDITQQLDAAVKRARAHDIVFVSIGTVPMGVFNAVYAAAGIPGIIEGQTMSSLAISLGKPFLQIPRPGHVIRNSYPSSLPGVDFSRISAELNDIATQLGTTSLADCLDARGATSLPGCFADIERVSRFILDAVDGNREISAYFGSVAEYFQKDIHDKIMIGLLALREVMRASV